MQFMPALELQEAGLMPKVSGPKFGVGTDVSRTEVDLAGDWYCNAMNCGAHNYASRTSCYKCGTPYGFCSGGVVVEGGLPGWKSGDWICTR